MDCITQEFVEEHFPDKSKPKVAAAAVTEELDTDKPKTFFDPSAA